MGHNLNKAFDLRNKARYIYNAEITSTDADAIIELAGKMLESAREMLE